MVRPGCAGGAAAGAARAGATAAGRGLTGAMPKFRPPERIEELYAVTQGNNFASINAPTSGARPESGAGPTPGDEALQLYSLATPNGWKAGILLEELGVPYDAHVVNIGKGEQFSAEFVRVNPNSKIPCLLDREGPDGEETHLFESGSILLYLAEKYGRFMPAGAKHRAEWQMAGQGPMTGNFGHFMVYAPEDQVEARNYGVARYGMEVQRLCSVLDGHLEGKSYLVNEEYSIADIACFPWAQMLLGKGYNRPGQPDAKDFLSIEKQYPNLMAWCARIKARPAVYRGMRCCNGSPKPWLEPGHAQSKSKL